MTIEKGTDWGTRRRLPDGGLTASSDAEVRALVETARRANEPLPVIGLLGGDLCRTLGGTGDAARLRSEEAMTFTIDVGAALLDGRLHWFVAHAIARRSWWHGRVVAIMNAEWYGTWDLAPRAHPNDGLLDISDGDLAMGERIKARSRLPAGTHVPHPSIECSRLAALQLDLDPALNVYLDGVRMARTRSLSVRLEVDALQVVV